MMRLDSFTEEEFRVAKENLSISLMSNVPSQRNPFAVLTGGQPGSGKTTIYRIYADMTHGDIVFINGDDFRKRHPNFLKLYKEYGGDFAAYTSEFSNRMVQEMIEYGAKRKVNMVIEGTLRTTSVPNATRSYLQENEFDVKLAVMVVRPEISYLSTLKRYQEMLDNGTFGRLTSKEDHDYITARIVENLNLLYREKRFNDILLFNRNKECLYQFKNTPDVNPALVMDKEFKRRLTDVEINNVFSFYGNCVERNVIDDVLRCQMVDKNKDYPKTTAAKNRVLKSRNSRKQEAHNNSKKRNNGVLARGSR